MKIKNVAIFGCGYVGLSLGLLLSRNYKIRFIDTDLKKIENLSKGISPISENNIVELLREKINVIEFTNNFEDLSKFQLAILAVPTNFIESKNYFDTSILESLIADIHNKAPHVIIVIKSTIPLGFTEKINKEIKDDCVIFSPEFLREGSAIADNLSPSRIILGGNLEICNTVKEVFLSIPENNPKLFVISSAEAELVKLASNTYLASRVAFFNEIDSLCLQQNLDASHVINCICEDPRIGKSYNNPSFGFGGYCLPKDTKQLTSEFKGIPNELISSISSSNYSRKKYIAEFIKDINVKNIGIYKLSMKTGSDNSRESAILDILRYLKDTHNILLYEPSIDYLEDDSIQLTNDLNTLKIKSDLILANRIDDNIIDVRHKVFSRDIFQEN